MLLNNQQVVCYAVYVYVPSYMSYINSLQLSVKLGLNMSTIHAIELYRKG